MSITGRHRSLALAESRLRALERKHGGEWVIASRRTDDGRFSSHGRNFTFERIEEEEEEEEEPEPVEYVVSETYKGASKGHNVHVQFSVFAPPTATRQQIIDAINAHVDNSALPKGFEVKSMRWNKSGKGSLKRSKNIRRDTDAFAAPLAFAETTVKRHRKG